MDYDTFHGVKTNYVYLECPGKEYYIVSNTTDEHPYDFIKPIGINLVEFLNSDLKGYDENLKKLSEILKRENMNNINEILNPMFSFMKSCLPTTFISGCYIHLPIDASLNSLTKHTLEKKFIYLPKTVYLEWYKLLKDYGVLYKRYRKFIDYCFNIDKKRFENINEAIMNANDDFPRIMRTSLPRLLTSAPMKNGKLDIDEVKKYNSMDADVMAKSNAVLKDAANFEAVYTTNIHSINEALFYEFSELVKNGYQIRKCKLCGKYFLLTNRRDREYCECKNAQGQTCAQLATKMRYKESLNDTYLKEYEKLRRAIYQRYFRSPIFADGEELTGSDMLPQEYFDWTEKASALRKKYVFYRENINADKTLTSPKKRAERKKIGEEFICSLKEIPLPHRPGRKQSGAVW